MGLVLGLYGEWGCPEVAPTKEMGKERGGRWSGEIVRNQGVVVSAMGFGRCLGFLKLDRVFSSCAFMAAFVRLKKVWMLRGETVGTSFCR